MPGARASWPKASRKSRYVHEGRVSLLLGAHPSAGQDLTIEQLKRQHSTDAVNAGSPAMHRSPASNTPTAGSETPPSASNLSTTPPALLTSAAYDKRQEKEPDEVVIGSPLKKQRASLPGLDDEVMRKRFGLGLSGNTGDVLGAIDHSEREVRMEAEGVEEEEL